MHEILRDTLSSAGLSTEILESGDGSSVLVLPYGGRVLGLFAPGSKENFLWTHPSLESGTTARAFYSSDEWHNSGGDRTWLAPEVDFFLPNFPKLDVYMQPREFDPGTYLLSRDYNSITLANRFTSQLSRSGAKAQLMLTKRVRLSHNPLRHGSEKLAGRLAYAGYSLNTRLQFTDEDEEHPLVGLWSLLQMPHGGELVIPTFSRSPIKTYMGNIEAAAVMVTDHLIRYRMNSVGEHKLGVPAAGVAGRAGYFYKAGGESCLVVRNFSVDPSGEYVDVPWHDTQIQGACVEACNVNSNLGAFSELEYHVPAIGGPENHLDCEDESQVWAFRGTEHDIVQAGRILLSSEL